MVIVLGSIILLYFGIILETIAPCGIISLRMIGPNPVAIIPVLFAVPSPVTDTILVHNTVALLLAVAEPYSNLLFFDLSKYLPTGAVNFINAPASMYVKSVAVYCPVLKTVPSTVSPKYPVV